SRACRYKNWTKVFRRGMGNVHCWRHSWILHQLIPILLLENVANPDIKFTCPRWRCAEFRKIHQPKIVNEIAARQNEDTFAPKRREQAAYFKKLTRRVVVRHGKLQNRHICRRRHMHEWCPNAMV